MPAVPAPRADRVPLDPADGSRPPPRGSGIPTRPRSTPRRPERGRRPRVCR
ncbi:hypothetical protein [Modestobacter marinus]|uniref:hypothetical protein n=1 Tax=Modestobacter marinus TaxID=477641 RepID=UPI001C947504|nr:hypothetical protein [Modestobacter marinus]